MERFQFDINGGKNEFHIFLEQRAIQEAREQEITKALNDVVKSYKNNKEYSSSVEYYLRLTVEYHKVILEYLANDYRDLDQKKWECQLVNTDSLGKTRKDILDCELFIDILLYYSHPDFPRINENKPYVTVQFKVITCYPNWTVYRPKLSYDLQYNTNKKRYPCEAYGLRNIDFYVWFYWCKLAHTWKKIYIMKEPNVLTPKIMLLDGNDLIPGFGELKVENPGKLSTKRTVQLNPNNQLFRENLLLELDNPDFDCGLLH